jgi:anti-sigma factor RsiW
MPRCWQNRCPSTCCTRRRQLQQRSSRLAQWQRWGGLAASVLVAFASGWAGHVQWQASGLGGAGARPTVAFAHQAAVAHVVYMPEGAAPGGSGSGAAAAPGAVAVQAPEPAAEGAQPGANGYELGRRPAAARAKAGRGAQFMFQNAAGERITLYVGAVDGARQQGMEETAFRYRHEGSIATFYWVDQGFGYALSGKLPRQGLLALAESVYKQL